MDNLRLPKIGPFIFLLLSLLGSPSRLQSKNTFPISQLAPRAVSEGNTVYVPLVFSTSGLGVQPDRHASATPARTRTPTPTLTRTNSPTGASPTATPLPPTATSSLTPTAASSSTPQPVGQPGAWNLKFSDEFNGASLDAAKWRTCFWWADTTCSITSNGELELYNPGDVLVQNGALWLRSQQRSMVGWNGTTYHYTSGMVMTGGRSGSSAPEFSFTYGYAEARVKVPAGQGLWPAFWLLPTSYAWPPEVDIMEILGNQPNVICMTYHYSASGSQGSAWTGPDFSAGWHVIGLDWEPNAIVWYVDGVERARYTNSANIPNTPLYLILNLAVGGAWPGAPDASTVFPNYFEVDYVRVWQK